MNFFENLIVRAIVKTIILCTTKVKEFNNKKKLTKKIFLNLYFLLKVIIKN